MKIYSNRDKALTKHFYKKAQNLFDKKNFYQAIKCYSQILLLNNNDKYAWTIQGRIFSLLNLNENALECYNKALQIDPNYNLAINYKRMVKYSFH